ncbi:MAG TPA: hypothetical protein VF746_11590 [Longimicrobium sp.]|jgi:hypothetical protein
MSTKERAIRVIEGLSEDATLDEIAQKLRSMEPDSPANASAVGAGGAQEPGAWELLAEATGVLEMPADWASKHDHYLYETPKRCPRA